MRSGEAFDLVVLGSGIAGLATALAAVELGLKVLVVEKSDLIGGGTCNSYGLLWVGDNHLAEAAGLADSRQAVLDYMHFVSGGDARPENLEAFVSGGRQALLFFEGCGVRFQLSRGVADHYFGIALGSMAEGRCLEAALISGHLLGDWQGRLRRPALQPYFLTAQEQVQWGGMNRRPFWDDQIVRERRQADMLGKGVGLAAQFLHQLSARNVEIRTAVTTSSLVVEHGRVAGVVLASGERVTAHRGVALAAGGYESNPQMVQAFEGVPAWSSPSPDTVTGDAMLLGCENGAAIHVSRNNLQFFLGFDVPVPGTGASEFHLAGIVELCSPHTIVVNRDGQRFSDESYFQGMVPKLREFDITSHLYSNIPCFLIFDSDYVQHYSFAGLPIGEIPDWVKSGPTPEAVATQLGIDPQGLADTVTRFNGFAETGIDEDFHRGEKAWKLAAAGEGTGRPNPALGRISRPPFYGLQLRVSGNASAGLLTNRHGQVLHCRGHAIPGLYALGNAAAHTEFGAGYQAGFTLASAMTFGWLAANHMAHVQLV